MIHYDALSLVESIPISITDTPLPSSPASASTQKQRSYTEPTYLRQELINRMNILQHAFNLHYLDLSFTRSLSILPLALYRYLTVGSSSDLILLTRNRLR